MMNKKGFTLTEVLLAAMIVGVMGVALAALTTSAVRESGMGRTKAILRNQISIALRQLRQDIQEAASVEGILDETVVPSRNIGIKLTKKIEDTYKLGPDSGNSDEEVTYRLDLTQGKITRNGADWLTNVKMGSPNGTNFYPDIQIIRSDENGVSSILRLRLVVEVRSQPVVTEYIDETFMVPQGF